jgi:hypothetical protein
MKGSITEEDWERIQEFTNAPAYEREPDILIPEDEIEPVPDQRDDRFPE